MLCGVDALVFCFLGGLPEKQIWTDRCAKHGDDGDNVILLPGKLRDQCSVCDFTPRHLYDQCRCNICQQGQGGPFEYPGVALITGKDFECRAAESKEDDIKSPRATNQQAQSVAHRSEISAKIDEVGNKQ